MQSSNRSSRKDRRRFFSTCLLLTVATFGNLFEPPCQGVIGLGEVPI